jgi:hypothetical protein
MVWAILGIIFFIIAFFLAANDYDPMVVWGLCVLGFVFILGSGSRICMNCISHITLPPYSIQIAYRVAAAVCTDL